MKKIVGTTTTRYLSKLYECDTTGANTSCSRFIWAGTQHIATVASSGIVHYWQGDHLGSSTVITDSTGARVQALAYYPYGDLRTNQSFTTPAIDVPYKYTRKELDNSSNLYFFESRYYHPIFGRFISPDTLVSNLHDPQSLNRYSYVGNNPLRYTDPTGHLKIGKFLHRAIHPGGLDRLIQHNLALRVLGWIYLGPGVMSFIDPVTRTSAVSAAVAIGVTIGTFGCVPCGGAAGGAVGAALDGQDVGRGAWIGAASATVGWGVGRVAGPVVGPTLGCVVGALAGGSTGGALSAATGGGNILRSVAIGAGTSLAYYAVMDAGTLVSGNAGEAALAVDQQASNANKPIAGKCLSDYCEGITG